MTKVRSIGLKKALFGICTTTGLMPTTLSQLARTVKGTASFNTESGQDADFYCEEEPAIPVESVQTEAGLTTAKLNLIEWDNAALIAVFGGTEDEAAGEVTVDGVTYTGVKKYHAPSEMVTVEKAVQLISLHNVVIDIPRAQIKARFVWNMTRTEIAQIERTCKVLIPPGENPKPYDIYNVKTVKATG